MTHDFDNKGYQKFDKETKDISDSKDRYELEERQQRPPAAVIDAKKPAVGVITTELHGSEMQDFERAQDVVRPKFSGLAIFWRDWWLESISCFLVVGTLAAIVGVVFSHQNQPLPHWKLSLSINALVSIFLTIMKSAMGLVLAQGLAHLKWTWFDNERPLQDLETYDKASHGPLGAAMLLLTVRNRHLITSIGAIVTIAALVIDPTVQAMVKYYDCPWPVEGLQAKIPTAQVYSELGLHAVAGGNTLPLGMQSAVNAGIFTPGQIGISFDCPTGNCTFPPSYSSIGYCSSCSNVSDQLKIRNYTAYLNTTNEDGSISSFPSYILNATLPSGLTASYDPNGVSTTALVMGASGLDGTVQLILGIGPQYIYGGQSDACVANGNPKSWPCKGYGAASCNLFPCVRTYSGRVAGGSLTETLSSSTSKWGSAPEGTVNYESMLNLTCLNPSERQALSKLGYDLDANPKWLAYNESFDLVDGGYNPHGSVPQSVISVAPRRCIYEVDTLTLNSLNMWFATFFPGSLRSYGEQFSGPSNLETIYNDGQVTFDSVRSTFENISLSMTSHIRQVGVSEPFITPVTGEVLHNVTCVRVRWQFLIFPAVIIVLMLTFFVAMVLETRKGAEGMDHDFKSSPLALMVHGLDTEVQDQLNSPEQKPRQATQDVKKLFVRLSPTEKGLKFVTSRQ
jgi:Protein of unknown function (DUF3176)